MRLLNTTTLELASFSGEPFELDFPRYAILSHTWGDDEVSLEDIRNLEIAREKRGFEKIAKCCQTAVAEGLEWAWIDTCCIDRDKSAELEEAINSMFKWYEGAAICYAYLSDIGPSGQHDWKKSRWFTRGWTLQELIAPFEVIVYDNAWKELGTKLSLAKDLHEVTGIPETVLLNSEARLEVSVAGRMSWARGRKTTRPEDTAYCLLGIFEIVMPLLYGEGIRALRRLHEEIVRVIPDDTVFFGGLSWEDKELGECWAVEKETTRSGRGFLVTPDNVPARLPTLVRPLTDFEMNSLPRPVTMPFGGGVGLASSLLARPTPGPADSGNIRLSKTSVSMSMRIVQVTLDRNRAALPAITANQQSHVELDPGSVAALEALNTHGPKLPGSPLCLGLLRCGPSSDKLLARYFLCREVMGGLEAYPTSVFRFVTAMEAGYWPQMQCHIFHDKDYFRPRPCLERIRDAQSWGHLESPLSGSFGDGWQWEFVSRTENHVSEDDGLEIWESESYELLYGQSAWGLTIALGPDKDVDFRIQVKLKGLTEETEPYAETVVTGPNGRKGQIMALHRRVPVAGGTSELVVAIYHGVDSGRHYYKPLIRTRSFEPTRNN
ncbi:heterokaryon incompatibility protein-domain-containing protein [Poronia punctata]|nr:heterokaryon incompatibility protein-domain-containing protein [Poronia punctata]